MSDEAPKKSKVVRGHVEPWTEEELDDMCTVTEADVMETLADSDEAMRALLTAEAPKSKEKP